MKTAAVALLVVACLAGCGGASDSPQKRADALQHGIGRLGKARITCNKTTCTVIVPTPLHSNYEGFLLSVPVFQRVIDDPALAHVKRVTLTLNDNASGQVFSITCAAGDLVAPMTPAALSKQCHSIYL
jgi:hypothetical protein